MPRSRRNAKPLSRGGSSSVSPEVGGRSPSCETGVGVCGADAAPGAAGCWPLSCAPGAAGAADSGLVGLEPAGACSGWAGAGDVSTGVAPVSGGADAGAGPVVAPAAPCEPGAAEPAAGAGLAGAPAALGAAGLGAAWLGATGAAGATGSARLAGAGAGGALAGAGPTAFGPSAGATAPGLVPASGGSADTRAVVTTHKPANTQALLDRLMATVSHSRPEHASQNHGHSRSSRTAMKTARTVSRSWLRRRTRATAAARHRHFRTRTSLS